MILDTSTNTTHTITTSFLFQRLFLLLFLTDVYYLGHHFGAWNAVSMHAYIVSWSSEETYHIMSPQTFIISLSSHSQFVTYFEIYKWRIFLKQSKGRHLLFLILRAHSMSGHKSQIWRMNFLGAKKPLQINLRVGPHMAPSWKCDEFAQ